MRKSHSVAGDHSRIAFDLIGGASPFVSLGMSGPQARLPWTGSMSKRPGDILRLAEAAAQGKGGRAMADDPKGDADEMGEWLDALNWSRPSKASERVDALLEPSSPPRAARARTCRSPPTPPTSTPSPSRSSPRIPATARSSTDPPLRPLERHGDGRAGQQGILRTRRPHRELRVGGDALRRRLQPFLARADETHGGDLVYFQGHASPGIYARAFLEGRLSEEQLRQLPPRSRRQGAVLLSASVADARFLAVPDGLDGPRAADGDLPGALHEVSARPRHRRHQRAQGLGLLRRRRDGRARIARRDLAGRRARSSTT